MNHPLLGGKPSSKASDSYAWQLDFKDNSLNYLKDHAIEDVPIVPGTAYVELGLAGINAILGHPPYRLSRISFEQILLISNDSPTSINLIIEQEAHSTWSGRATTTSREESSQETFARFTIDVERPQPLPTQEGLINTILDRCQSEYSGTAIYDRFKNNHNNYGPTFQNIANLYLGEHECLASLRLHSLVESNVYQYHVHPAILDACVQTLANIDFSNTATYVLASIEDIQIYQFPSKVGWIHARSSKPGTNSGLSGDIDLYDTNQELVLSMKGITLKYLNDKKPASPKSPKKNKIVIAATFTADPVEASLNYWMDTSNTPAEVLFSPYNQIFQEILNPGSLLSNNSEGINVLMLRFQDWAHHKALNVQVGGIQKEQLLSQREHHTLPNQIEIAHLNTYETEYLYKEIFQDQTYLKHGIDIPEHACVIDVGANIGMFTLFVLSNSPDARIYSFEPSPPAFEALETNTTLYGKNVVPFNIGLSDSDGKATFTFYNNSSVFSSFHADQDLDKAAIQTVVENVLVQSELDQESVDTFSQELMERRLQKQTFSCVIKTLSTVIEEEQIDTIDLLKVDVEKSELQVLKGIKAEHWPKIRQLVIEVHDTVGPVIEEVTSILTKQGFDVVIEEEELLQESGLYNLYARRPEHTQTKQLDRQQIVLEQNIKDLAKSLSLKQQSNNAPCLIVTCPENPETYTDALQDSPYVYAESLLNEEVASIPNVSLITYQDILKFYPVDQYYDPTGLAIGDVPYTPAFYSAMGTSIARRIQSIYRKPYKVIILDCDNTLWDGVVGDLGAHGVQITPGHAALQSFMVKQHDAGMLLCLCSKNAEDDVMAVFDENKHMILKRDHIVSTRINWNKKSDNIISLAEELDLGTDSFIFLDDNPVECAEVKARLPEVLTLHIPESSSELASFLDHIWAFDHLSTTSEDRKRTRLYQQNIQRAEYQKETLSFASFIEGLQLQIEISEPADHQIPRFAQLTQRTNQFNVTTKRRSEHEVNAWLQNENNFGLIVSVSDRFGDYGLVGALLYSMENQALNVDSFILSCRVLGKGVEHAMLRRLGTIAQNHNLPEVHVPFMRTPKNLPALRFLTQASTPGIKDETISGNVFTYSSKALSIYHFNPEDSASPEQPDAPKSTTRSRSNDHSSEHIERIARELRDTEDILQAVKTHALRARPEQDTEFIAPGKKLEQSIALIWQDILGIQQIGLNDNFFEIGGTSLKAVQIISRIRNQLGADISLVNMFDKPNIRALAELLEQDATNEYPTPPSVSRQRGEMRRAHRVRRNRQRKN